LFRESLALVRRGMATADARRRSGKPCARSNCQCSRSLSDQFEVSLTPPRTHRENVRLPPAVSQGQGVNVVKQPDGPAVDFAPHERHDVERCVPAIAAERQLKASCTSPCGSSSDIRSDKAVTVSFGNGSQRQAGRCISHSKHTVEQAAAFGPPDRRQERASRGRCCLGRRKK